jgi:E3 ubiquitin-protein ligase HERC4
MSYVFGDNRFGQAGASSGEEILTLPIEILNINVNLISSAVTNQNQTYIILKNGEVYTSGSNDNNELGRFGKRSLLQRVEALETFQITDATLGDGFFSLVCKDGRIISWGKNDMGQLGNGTRDFKDKPRFNTQFNESLLQISSGSQHCIALSKTGKVFTFGGNKRGQIGDGQLTSSTVPKQLMQLRHRPVIAIACGENHSLALTAGGNIFAWGDNSQGQLGLSDTTNRLRPEIIRSLRAVKPSFIACGKQHSIVITKTGIVFSFGSNGFGQCGLGQDIRLQAIPIVVEKLRDYFTVQVACGACHTVVLCEQKNVEQCEDTGIKNKVFVMGLNSSGQVIIY